MARDHDIQETHNIPGEETPRYCGLHTRAPTDGKFLLHLFILTFESSVNPTK